ncbi:ecdysteroid kinase domain-containing protein [Phthorimaea operculella]|nr:ecdysteroid kinase domain-containing protein [Phthorimaea operculella]
MTLEFAELAVRHLAMFHGLFYVLQRNEPNYFENNLRNLKAVYNFNEEWDKFLLNFIKLTTAVLTSETKEKLQKFIPTTLKKCPMYFRDATFIGCTVCHGDYRRSNILVKYTVSMIGVKDSSPNTERVHSDHETE